MREVQMLKKKGKRLGPLAYDNVYALGGRAYKLDCGEVECKMLRLVQSGAMKHVVKVFGTWKIPSASYPRFGAAMELLHSLDTEEKCAIDNLANRGYGCYSTRDRAIDPSDANEFDGDVERKVGRQIIAGLCELREVGILYSDLHSANVLKTEGGIYKVIDLGHCFLNEESDQEGYSS